MSNAGKIFIIILVLFAFALPIGSYLDGQRQIQLTQISANNHKATMCLIYLAQTKKMDIKPEQYIIDYCEGK